MALALAGMLGPEQDYIKGTTPTDAAIIEGKKTTLALGDLAAKQKAQDYVNGNLKDLYSQARRNDLSAEGAAALMQYSPDLYNHLATLQKDASDDAKRKEIQAKNMYAGSIAFVGASPDQPQAWLDARAAHHMNGIPGGIFDQEYSPELFRIAKLGAAGLDSTKFTPPTGEITQKDGIIYQETPVGQKFLAREPDAKRMKADWKMKVDENGNPVTKQADVGGRTQTFAVEVDDQGNERISTKPLGLSAPPRAAPRQAAPKLVQTVDDQGNLQWESVGGGQVPKGKPIQKNGSPSGEESKDAGFYSRMKSVSPDLDALESKGGPTAITALAASLPFLGGIAGRTAMTPIQQQYQTAAMGWIRAKLRKESGAVIGPQEAKDEWTTYFPVVGDTPENIQYKRKLRAIAENEMKISSGKAAPLADKAIEENLAAGGGSQNVNMQHYQAALKAAAGNPAKIKAINDRARQMGIIK